MKCTKRKTNDANFSDVFWSLSTFVTKVLYVDETIDNKNSNFQQNVLQLSVANLRTFAEYFFFFFFFFKFSFTSLSRLFQLI